MKILVSDSISKKGIDALQSRKNVKVDVRPKLPKEELAGIIGDYDALIVRSETKVTKEIIEKADKLKVIGRAGVGIDNVDVESATKKGIVVMNTPEGNTVSAAEHTISLILALSRKIPLANASLKCRKWERSKYEGVELLAKTLGIIGLGKIGLEVAKRMQSFGMKIIAYDPYMKKDFAGRQDIELLDLDVLLKRSDFITIHTPLTKDTKHLIGRKELGIMKKTAMIINVARGGIIDEDALYSALNENRIAGCALDVFEKEPPLDSPLLELDNIIVTPHLGASTLEAQEKVAVEIVEQVADFLSSGTLKNAVNFPSIDSETMKKLQPYIGMTEKMGRIMSAIVEGGIKGIEISYSGDISNFNTTPLTSAFLKGLFESIMENSVNYINSLSIAQSRGISVAEKKTAGITEYSNLVHIDVSAEKTSHSVSATMFSNNESRLVNVDDYRINVVPSGNILIVFNNDVPGVIGSITTLLGRNRINISGLQNSRLKQGKDAITIINVDSDVSNGVLEEIRTSKNVNKAITVRL